MKTVAKALAKRLGYDVRTWHPNRSMADIRRRLLAEVECAVDVGAHAGGWATETRAVYRGPLISFEPQPGPFKELEAKAAADPRWDCHQIALGSAADHLGINVAAAGDVMSSLLTPTAYYSDAVADGTIRRTVQVPVERLDSFDLPDQLYLKADVQGYEMEVLNGADGVLPSVKAIEIELSLVPLYEGQPLMAEMLLHLERLGFTAIAFEPLFWRPDGRLLQLDGIFTRGH